MSEHTPGPWDYQNDTITSKHGDIARIHYQSSRDKKGWDDRPLMAAAPELLAALKEIAEECEYRLRKGEDSGDRHTLKLCRAAISKTEGRAE